MIKKNCIRSFSKVFIALAVFVPLALGHAQASSQAQLAKNLSDLMKPYGQRAGLSLRDHSGKLVASINGDRAFVPASVSKLVSSACALKELGPNFKMSTSFYQRGQLVSNVLKGDLVIRGGGDFSFVIENLKILVEQLYYIHGIHAIEGSIIFQTGLFKEARMRIMEGFEGDKGRAFNALLTPVPINHNAFSVWLKPQGEQALVSIHPEGAIDLKVNNKVSVGSGQLGGSRTRLNYLPQFDRLELSGKIGRSDRPKAYYLSLKDPYESFARLFKANYRALGGRWEGQVRLEKTATASDKLLFEHQSRAISRLLIDINKLSTNFGSEMLNLQAAYQKYKKPVSATEGQAFLESCVEESGFTSKEINLVNASGLARTSRIQPNALSAFLNATVSSDFGPEYLSTLSVMGRDGTTRRRLRDNEGRARLKTGTIRGVNTIAGYIGSDIRNLYSFVMLLNCEGCGMRDWEKAENQAIRLVLQHQDALRAPKAKP